MSEKAFTPAAGYAALTPLYDISIGLLTREETWRSALIEQVAATGTDRILDVGCGTGSLAIKMKLLSPNTEIHGIDPDRHILRRAQAKAMKKGADIAFHHGFLVPTSVSELGHFSTVVSSLVFHQTPLEEKRNILYSIVKLLEPNGKLCIADYGLQRTTLMKTLFRRTIQVIDGYKDTQPNAEGCLPKFMEEAGFVKVSEVRVIPTITGSISIYVARVSP
jgi:ubiquinone/menaquinone biosynthesis C-methylase UbiE